MAKNKSQKIIQWFQEQVQNQQLSVNQKLPTEAELCEQFGVSRNAVRHALSLMANDMWLNYKKHRGYFITQKFIQNEYKHSLTRRKAHNIGLLCFFPGHYIFPDIIAGFNSVIKSKAGNMILKQSEYEIKQEREALVSFLQQNISGLIAEPIFDGTSAANQDLYKEISKADIPIVFLDNYIPNIGASSILCDDKQGGRKSIELFLDKGYRDFILFYQKNYLSKSKRIQGALEVLQRTSTLNWQQLSFSGQRQHSDIRKKCHNFFQVLPKQDAPMAWLCSSDEDAAIVIELAGNYQWKLHRDYELIGFDNSQLSQLIAGGFSSFTHPGELMGRMSARYLLDQLEKAPKDRHLTRILVESNFVERNFHALTSLERIKKLGSKNNMISGA